MSNEAKRHPIARSSRTDGTKVVVVDADVWDGLLSRVRKLMNEVRSDLDYDGDAQTQAAYDAVESALSELPQ